MPRPRTPYKLEDGTVVPGVTTITGRFKDSGGLIYWAWTQGRDGKDLRETKDKAADVGTLVHGMVEERLRGHDPVAWLAGYDRTSEIFDRACQGYQNWLAWKEGTALEIEPWEKPMVCEHHKYGGTPDALLRSGDGLVSLGDWKGSKGIYPETLLQLAAYAHLFEDMGLKLGGGFHIGRFSPEHGDFSHHHFSELDDAWEMFKHLRRAYDYDKLLKGRV